MIPAELIKSCAKGDAAAQRVVYDEIEPRLMGTCLRYAGNREDAEEIFQDSMLKIFLNIGKFKVQSSLLTWATRITINTALDFLRRKKKQPVFEYVADNTEADPVDLPDHAISADGETALTLLQKLSFSHQMFINLHIIDGFSHREIANALNISEEASRSQLSRAKKALISITLKALQSDERQTSSK